ncbi:MAG: hypothetical protein ACFFG0_09185 [Candidatus Thorarchaeota archaeon]
MMKRKIIVDGSNIAFASRNHKKQPKFKNLDIIINFLENIAKDFPIDFKIIVDASLRYQIDSKKELEQLEKIGKIIQSPCKHTADEFIIEYAHRYPEETIIISNDRFSEYKTENLTIFNFLIVFEEIIIKPTLREYLEFNKIVMDGSQVDVCEV